MKKIDLKFSKRQAVLFVALIALTGFGAWSANTLSSSESQASVDSLKHVTEHVSDVPSSVEPETADNTVVNVAPTTQEAAPEPKPAEALTVYEKYDVSESAMLPFINAYPDYFAVNNDVFIRDVSSIVKKYPNNGAQRLEEHRRISGFMIPSDSPNYRQAEKNSFIQLIINEVPTSSEYWFTAL